MGNKIATTLLLLVLTGIFLVLSADLPSHTQFWKEIQNAGHIPLFGILSLVILSLSRQLFDNYITRQCAHYLFALVTTVLIGIAVELIQLFGDRQASHYDVLRNGIGAITFLGIRSALDLKMLPTWYKRGNVARRLLLLGSIALLGTSFIPLGLWTAAYAHRAQAFPRILTFESYWERKFLVIKSAELVVVTPPVGWGMHNRVGKLRLKPAIYPGLLIQEPYPNWTGYRSLAFTIYSEMHDPIVLSLRIDDIHHNNAHEDRFNHRITVEPGINQFVVPIEEIKKGPTNREMDMTKIALIVLFASHPHELYTINIDNIRLE